MSVGFGWWLKELGWIRIDGLPPLYAEPRRPAVGLMLVVALAAALVVAVSRVAARCPWRVLPVVCWALAAGWAVALAASDGPGALAAPLRDPAEYLAGLPAMGDDPLGWLRRFTSALPSYPTHVKGHPPLPMLILWGLRRAGLGGAGWAATLVIAAGSSAAAAVAITIRRLAGERAARRALPYLVLAPYALWIATSVDALFLGVGAWGIALLVLGCTGERRGRWCFAFAAGLLIGALPYLSYGLLPLAVLLPPAVLVMTRPPPAVLGALAGGLAVLPLLFTLAGFWWFDGVAATHAAWAAGAGAHRPYIYFLVGDLAVLALMTGPALPALTRTLHAGTLHARTRPPARIWSRARMGAGPRGSLAVLVAAALLAVLALDVAGVTRGEVERIWLPYAAWIMAVTAFFAPPPGRPAGNRLLFAQAATALALQAFVRSPW